MEIKVDLKERVVEIWLTREEKNNEEIKKSLVPIYSKCKKEKFIVAVFESGEKELLEGTKALLIHNMQKQV